MPAPYGPFPRHPGDGVLHDRLLAAAAQPEREPILHLLWCAWHRSPGGPAMTKGHPIRHCLPLTGSGKIFGHSNFAAWRDRFIFRWRILSGIYEGVFIKNHIKVKKANNLPAMK